MKYTAQTKEELLQQIEAYLKDENTRMMINEKCEDEVSLMYVLWKKYAPEQTLIAVANKDNGVYMLYPYAGQDDFSEPWDYDADNLLFEQLGDGYEILSMTDDAHSDVWLYVSEMGRENIWFKRGMRLYFDYCHKNGITKEKLERECSYDGKDIMRYYVPYRTSREER